MKTALTVPPPSQFDDLAALPLNAGPGPDVPTPYKDLAFRELNVVNTDLVPEVLFHTPPHGAIHGSMGHDPIDTTLHGRAPIVLDSKYPGSKVASFDLKSFWFACKSSTSRLGTAAVAVACSLAVTGYRPRPQQPEVCDVIGVRGKPPLPFPPTYASCI